MLARYKVNLAKRVRNPFLRLLILDWRFSCLLILLACLLMAGILAPLRIWKRTPPDLPEIRISALDFFQAYSLSRAARKAEAEGKLDLALSSWGMALANDPCDAQICSGYVRALTRSGKFRNRQRALQVANWLRAFSPGAEADEVFILAAGRNEAWASILETLSRIEFAKVTDLEVRLTILKALFRSRNYAKASEYLSQIGDGSDRYALFREALDCVAGSGNSGCRELEQRMLSGPDRIDAHELRLISCAEKQDLAGFRDALASLKQLTDDTLAFDLIHARFLLGLSRLREAREVALALAAPRSAAETFQIAQAHLSVGQTNDALSLLGRFCPEFADTDKHWILYSTQLLKRGELDELSRVAAEIQQSPVARSLQPLLAAIRACRAPTEKNIADLKQSLSAPAPSASNTDMAFFSAEALLAAGRPDSACEILLQMEPSHLQDSEFYIKLFAAAEANRDAELMRRTAARRYELTPNDLLTVLHYSAMLIMFDEEREKAVKLSAQCAGALPQSMPVKLNYAAALINADQIGSADLILREIDEAQLSSIDRNRLYLVQLKRAIKIHDRESISRWKALVDESQLYAHEIRWLKQMLPDKLSADAVPE